MKVNRYMHRFARNRDGVSAVEFALVLPLMITLYLGSVELGEGLAIQFKSTVAARTASDLAAQFVSIDNTSMGNILNAATTVVAPYPVSGMVVTVSEISIDSSGRATITWSCSLNGTARIAGSSITLPSAFSSTKSISLIWGEVTYPFTPQMGYVITGTINMYESVMFYPRLSSSVSLSSCT